MANARKKISELPALSVASLDTTFVLGISGSTTYKISINNLTSSLDTTFATDLVTNALSSSLNSKLSTSSFNSYTASAINGTISGSSQLTSSFDQRYVVSGSITQTTWDNIANKPNDIVSSSTQISDLGFVTGSYTTLNSFNNLTQSFNSISQSFTTISGSFGDIDFSGINAVTESYLLFTQSYYSASASVDSRITTEKNRIDAILSASNANSDTFAEVVSLINSVDLTNDNAFATFYTASNGRLTSLENATSSYLTSLNGAISSSIQVLNGSGIFSSSAQLPSGLLSSSLGFVATSSYTTDSASFNSRIISGSAVAGTISSSAQISALGYATTSSVTTLSSSVDSRLDTLEGTIISGSPNYVQTLSARVTGVTTIGAIIVSGSITTTGNPIQIMVTGDANPSSAGASWTRLQIFRDGNGIGNIIQVENTQNLNVPYCLNVIDTPTAGTYTYSMRTVSGIAGQLDFGEHNGPLLTAVELRTNTNLPSTNNTFTGNNTFNGITTFGTFGGDEGGEIQFGIPQTNTTLQNRVTTDIFQNRLRIFEGSANSKGVYIDLSKAPAGNSGEITWKVSGFVNAGTFLTLDNLKVSVTTGVPRGLSMGAVSSNFTANISGWYGMASFPVGGSSSVGNSITTTATTSVFGWDFGFEGNTAQYNILDTTNSRMYRVTMMIGNGFFNNFISIERLH